MRLVCVLPPNTFQLTYNDASGNALQATLFSPSPAFESCQVNQSVSITRAVINELTGQHQIFADGPDDGSCAAP